MERPGGYFATFVVESSGHYPRRTRSQKRNRRTLVCNACHERKLRCDKNLPCGRCASAGMGHACSYQNSADPAAPEEPPAPPPARNGASSPDKPASAQPASRPRCSDRPGGGRFQVSGTTHWSEIASEFEEARPYLFGTDPRWDPQKRRLKEVRSLFPALLDLNFPFGHRHFYAESKERALEITPPRRVIEALVDNYMSTYESTYRLFHPPQFRDELDAYFRDREGVSDGWCAQLCMVLAFGCQTAAKEVFDGTGYYAGCWTVVLLDAAELFLKMSPYMAAPDLTAIRTLCLVVLARQADIFNSGDAAPLVTVTGILRNLAVTMNLHRTSSLFDGMPEFEAEIRRRLWTTVRLLGVDVAMRCGTAPLSLESDVGPTLNLNDEDYVRGDDGEWRPGIEAAGPDIHTDGTFQTKLHQLLPLLENTITRVNSPLSTPCSDDEVASLDGELRKRLEEIHDAFALPAAQDAARAQKASVQRRFLEILVHRTALSLHHTPSRAQHGASPAQAAISRARIMDSSLALLQIHHQCVARTPPRHSSIETNIGPSPDGGWLLDVCHDDFSAAVMYNLNAARWREVERRSGDGSGDTGSGCHPEVASGRALTLARQSAEIMSAMSYRSVAHQKEFVSVSIMLACLECIAAGERDMYPRMAALADWLETRATSEGTIWSGVVDAHREQEARPAGLS